ncbi:MAG: TIGR03905 family TSCPD domain-containing protein [Ruminococcaceae bacterium]|nr:TIGR03905 family TSCPD domain-containing protein [Oscillospiraceae bacterium]MBR3596978.1 TIGR03905 family TSCPD domain-containing protein [Clostridia bacterium]
MTYIYKTSGTCAASIEIELTEDNIIENVRFIGGCKGNTQGISALVKGMRAEDVIDRVSGIRCGFKPTSCPDQLSLALKKMLEEK